jgi:hypothetical protein
MKRCSKCGEVKSCDQFSRNATRRDGLQHNCKSCQSDYLRQWQSDPAVREARSEYRRLRRADPAFCEKERERSREYQRQRRADPAIREADSEYCRQRRLDPTFCEKERQRRADPVFKETAREQARQRRSDPAVREHESHYRKTEQGRMVQRSGKANRRARERSAPGRGMTAADIRAIAAGQTDRKGRLRCWWCGKVIEGTPHLDHRISLKNGGANDPANCCLSCASCNLKKSARGPEWAGRLV